MLKKWLGKMFAPSAPGGGGWYPIVREPFSGAWQQNKELCREDLLAYYAIFSCLTLIASDISKLNVSLRRKDSLGIWQKSQDSRLTKLLYKPNTYQTGSQFLETWILSKFTRGNTYVLIERSSRGVNALHVLHPDRITPLISDDGQVFYTLGCDNLAGIERVDINVPASEIIHDRFNCLYHPLVGVSPIYACAMAALQGTNILRNSSAFFGNNSSPGGILTAPGAIHDDTAKRLKEEWTRNYTGANAGKIAVVGDGLKYEPLSITAAESQLIEQLRWTADIVCSVFHVPRHKIGIGDDPTYSNIEALDRDYYARCLQKPIIDIQTLLNLALEVPEDHSFRFDLDGLLMMDSQTQMNTLKEGIGAGLLAPNEGRRKLNLSPVTGGDTPYLQQQNYSLEALNRRDTTEETPSISEDDQSKMLEILLRQELYHGEHAGA